MSEKTFRHNELDPPPTASASAPDEARTFHVTWESPIFGLSGYAATSRAAIKALDEAGVRVRVLPLGHEKES